MKGITVEITQEISIERIQDLLCCALEGGSNYWYCIEKFVEPKEVTHPQRYADDREEKVFRHLEYPTNPGGALLISDRRVVDDEGDMRTERLDLASIERGLKVMSVKYPRHFADFMKENDDADTGDVFLQCCLFGELVYG